MYTMCAARHQLCERENAGTYKEKTSRTYYTFLTTYVGKKHTPDEIHPPKDFVQVEAQEEDKTKNKGLAHASILHCLTNTVFSPANALEHLHEIYFRACMVYTPTQEPGKIGPHMSYSV